MQPDSPRRIGESSRVDLLDVDLQQLQAGWAHLAQSIQQAGELELQCGLLEQSHAKLELCAREQQRRITELEQELVAMRVELDGARKLIGERDTALQLAAAENNALRAENRNLCEGLVKLEAALRDSQEDRARLGLLAEQRSQDAVRANAVAVEEANSALARLRQLESALHDAETDRQRTREWVVRIEKEKHEMECALKGSQEDAEQRRQRHAFLVDELEQREQRLAAALAELESSRGWAVRCAELQMAHESVSSLHAAAEQQLLTLQNKVMHMDDTSRATAALLADERLAHAELLRRFDRSAQALDEANAKAGEVPLLKQRVLDLEADVGECRRSRLVALDECNRVGELEQRLASLSIEMDALRTRLCESATSLSSAETRLESTLGDKERVVFDLAEARRDLAEARREGNQLRAGLQEAQRDLQQAQRVLLKTEESLETHRQMLQAALTREARVHALESRLQAQSMHVVRLEDELCNLTKELERSTTECVRLSRRLSEVERHDYGITSAVKALQLEAEEWERTFSPTRLDFNFSQTSVESEFTRHFSLQGAHPPMSPPMSLDAKLN
jgi:chromosome segregation ATPase